MASYSIKRFSTLDNLYTKYFSEEKKSNTLKKALGIGLGAAAIAGTAYGAKKGVFGKAAQNSYKNMQDKISKKLGGVKKSEAPQIKQEVTTKKTLPNTENVISEAEEKVVKKKKVKKKSSNNSKKRNIQSQSVIKELTPEERGRFMGGPRNFDRSNPWSGVGNARKMSSPGQGGIKYNPNGYKDMKV